MRRYALFLGLIGGVMVALGCDAKKATGEGTKLPTSQLPDAYWLKTAPAGAKPAAEVREKAKTGDPVVVAGIVGGRKAPFSEGMAVFTIVDKSAKHCTPEECETPWDFCCEPPEALTKGTVTVEFREGGRPLRYNARGFHGLDHMKNVVVTGDAIRDEAGTVLVVAKGIYIEP
jgi:hypothetical protein